MNIIIYTKTGCPWCVAATDYLKENNVEHEERNVTNDPALFKEMEDKSGQTKAPTFDINGKIYPDSDVEELKKILEEGGFITIQ